MTKEVNYFALFFIKNFIFIFLINKSFKNMLEDYEFNTKFDRTNKNKKEFTEALSSHLFPMVIMISFALL